MGLPTFCDSKRATLYPLVLPSIGSLLIISVATSFTSGTVLEARDTNLKKIQPLSWRRLTCVRVNRGDGENQRKGDGWKTLWELEMSATHSTMVDFLLFIDKHTKICYSY
jgi:hypothetical protein